MPRHWFSFPAITCALALTGGLNAIAPAHAQEVPPGDLPAVQIVPAFSRLRFERPVGLVHAGDGSNRLFVIEQKGKIRVFENRADATEAPVFLDLSERVHMGHNEEGLLSLAFHPDHETNGYLYVYYSATEPRRGVLSRFSVSTDDPDVADATSEHIIMEVEQPYGNHNGSTVLFGPDGYLYFSLGDGGWANDPHGHGQNLATLLGTVLRIDVNRTEGDRPYAIPADNPFVDRPGARGEIWAYGLRNIWRMSFDRETGQLWAGDVGQNLWEEVDLIVRGGNYGWRNREGLHKFAGGESDDPLIDPVVEYPRADGLSITGGHVYRGSENPRLVGAYVYADYVSGKIWALHHDGEAMTAHRLIHEPERRRFISSFGEDETGELYLCIFTRLDGRGDASGSIYKLREQ